MAERFASNEEAVAYMKEVAVGRSGFSRFLGVEPLRVWWLQRPFGSSTTPGRTPTSVPSSKASSIAVNPTASEICPPLTRRE